MKTSSSFRTRRLVRTGIFILVAVMVVSSFLLMSWDPPAPAQQITKDVDISSLLDE